MEALQAVEKEENRLSNKYSNYRKNLTKNLDDLIEHVRSVKEGLCQGM